MAHFGYAYGTGSTYTAGNARIGPRFNPENFNYRTQPAVDYDLRPLPEVHPDHVCRPVAVDAYGRPIPGVVVLPADQRVTQTEYATESVYSSKTHPNHNRVDRGLLDCDNGKCKPLFSPTREQVLLPNEDSSGPRTGRFPAGMFQRRAGPEDAGRNWQFGRVEAPPPTGMYEQRTGPSSDVFALTDYVRDAARPKVGRFTAAPVVETIDHNEAQRRYNNNVPATGTGRVDPSLPTIDHRAAALKYNGALVN